MRVISPDNRGLHEIVPSVDLFLAGGITNCPDWQAEALALLRDQDIAVANPRRKRALALQGKGATHQIEWEYGYLKRARVVLFWFPKESLCPIALFELGKELESGSRVVIGVHPEYSRRFDVITQVRCYDPEFPVYDKLADVVAAAVRALNP
jgi:hypothetical protein